MKRAYRRVSEFLLLFIAENNETFYDFSVIFIPLLHSPVGLLLNGLSLLALLGVSLINKPKMRMLFTGVSSAHTSDFSQHTSG